MSSIERYATKEDIVYFVKLFNPNFDGDKIQNTFLKIINAKIDQWIIEHSVNPRNRPDKLNMLWAAVITMALEWLCYTGDLMWSTGDVAIQTLNKVTYGFQRWQPMFFFATGASDSFKGLLPHETYRMMAYSYVDAFCRDDFFRNHDTVYPIPRISRDNTTRGWNWNIEVENMETADLESISDEASFESYYIESFEEWDED